MRGASMRWGPIFLIALLALGALLWWALLPDSSRLQIDEDTAASEEVGEREAAALAPYSESTRGAVQVDPTGSQERTEVTPPQVEGFEFRGRLVFPESAEWDPQFAQVYAVRKPDSRSWHLVDQLLAQTIVSGGPSASSVAADGSFKITLPGEDALDHHWAICAGAPGWYRALSFPDVRPQSPPPSAEVQFEMQALYGASIELRMTDGSRPQIDRNLFRTSGGSGLHYFAGWSWGYPLNRDSAEVQLGLPAELRSQVVGGQDAARGLAGPELAVVTAHPNMQSGPGYVLLSYKLAPPGFDAVERGLELRNLASGFPAYQIDLVSEGESGSLRFDLDEADWWTRELGEFGLGGLSFELQRGNEEPWVRRFDALPKPGSLNFAGLPAGEYQLSVRTRINDLVVPVYPSSVLVVAGQEATARANLCDFGAIVLDVRQADRETWAAGRFAFTVQAQQDAAKLRFFGSEWPVRLGPIRDQSVVVKARAIDGDNRLRAVDRLNAPDEFLVPRKSSVSYLIGGLH